MLILIDWKLPVGENKKLKFENDWMPTKQELA